MLFKDIHICGNFNGKPGDDYHNIQNSVYIGSKEGNRVKKEYSESITYIGKV